VAQKMSWAAKRKTTRIEDEAYCLLGLFDLNMPPLDGEERKAFMRLQLEILKKSGDESIFVWHGEFLEELFGCIRLPLSGLLASTPVFFFSAFGRNQTDTSKGSLQKLPFMEG
jgi:hypothetical protein